MHRAFRLLVVWGGVGLLSAKVGCWAQAKGAITEVRVYRGQALVTRVVPFEAQPGPQEVVVTELPERIVPESLYATGGEGVMIRAVRYRTTAVGEEPREEVRALDEQIRQRQEELSSIESQLGVLKHKVDYLAKLEAFVAPTAQVELTKGVLDPNALMEITRFMFEQRTQVADQQLALESQKATLEEQLGVLRRQRAQLMAGFSKSLREAVVFLEAAAGGARRLTLNYLVDGVGWSPAYIARLNGDRKKLLLEYNAVVTQASGEDWPGVQLTLSTSYPTMVAEAPLLSPLWVSLVPAGQEVSQAAAEADVREYAQRQAELRGQIRSGKPTAGLAGLQGPAGPTGGGAMPQQRASDEYLAANVLAAELQHLELAAPDEVVRTSKRLGATDAESLAVDYPLPGRISLQSRDDQQMFRIAALELAAHFYYRAVPLLSDYVYQAVEATNTSEYPLLPGPYNAYVEGAFAGRGQLGLVARGQSLTLGFGTETRLRIARELDEKTTEIRGGNQVVKYTYRLRLQNFMPEPVIVQVWERLPQAPEGQVTVTLLEPHPPLSEDPLYRDQERPRGLLRWDLEVPAQAAGARAFSFTYSFRLEFDRNSVIGELPAQAIEKMREDLDVLRELRH